MSKPKPSGAQGQVGDSALYALLDQLDRLEELLEEMDELGVASRDDVEQRLAELHAEVDRFAPDEAG
jgi:hypothetical protein